MRSYEYNRRGAFHAAWLGGVAWVAVAAGCGDDSGTAGTSSSTTSSAQGGSGQGASGPGGGGQGGSAQGGGGPGGSGPGGSGQGGSAQGGAGGGIPAYSCSTTAPRESHGSAIALSPDDKILVVANRDVGTVSVLSVDYASGSPAMTKVAEIPVGSGAGSEPWQVAIDGCGQRAYVVLRRDQKLVTIEGIDTATPSVGLEVATGSEPTGLALSPNNTRVYVANWVDGTVSIFDGSTLASTNLVDMNIALANSGLLGSVEPRPALAHPRSIAVTNDGDAQDNDESVIVTEWFAQRTGPEGVNGVDADTSKKGLAYRFFVGGSTPTLIDLPSVANTGFLDTKGNPTGCFPNQVSSVNVKGAFAFVTSTCASPEGPLGVLTATGACSTNADCGDGGTCTSGTCSTNTINVKTTTHPALSIVDLGTNTATTVLLDAGFDAPSVASGRMPHLPSDVSFFNDFLYLSAEGADAVFRVTPSAGQIAQFGSQTNAFINLRKDANDKLIRLPVGVATAHNLGQATGAFAFVANEGSRDVTALALASQSIATGASPTDFRITQSSELPAANSEDEKILRGKRFFNTGLGRWSLLGEAWGSCAACHIDGLSDNVTWYFARGPRQSTSLDGSFASNDPTDQRIFNWTAIFDEVADFELNTRNVSGGKGAIVDANDNRINLAGETPPQQGLQGSTKDVADPQGISAHPHSALDDWEEVEAYIQSIRSPRKPSTLNAADVDAGRTLFQSSAQGNCVGCHSGAKWTVSTVFYPPSDKYNTTTISASPDSLSNISWNTGIDAFPAAIRPVDANNLVNAFMRRGAAPAAEQLQCALREVGTFGVSPSAVGVAEVRVDMTTLAQGSATDGRGFNPPSLLGMQVGAPFFHAGNARTLEELFDSLFAGHHQSAVAAVFSPTATQKRQLVAYLLSIDEDEAVTTIPNKGATGGALCFIP
jgi:YVTN family beta-propeller protein